MTTDSKICTQEWYYFSFFPLFFLTYPQQRSALGALKEIYCKVKGDSVILYTSWTNPIINSSVCV